MTDHLLTIVTFMPLVGAVVLLLWRGAPDNSARSAAMLTSVATFIVSLAVLGRFERADAAFQMVERATWVKSIGLQYLVGVDGVSLWMVLLTTFLFPLSVLASWTVEKNVRLYMVSTLVLETAVIGSFVALDLLLFFVFFEALLVPMYLIIGGWGGERRIYAALKFFLYTMAGSAFLLVGILFLFSRSAGTAGRGTFDVQQLMSVAG
ncbi:MAG: proton-conducting transporter transmembrane domain-containing protein, partial [Actinomycetota bacterium]